MRSTQFLSDMMHRAWQLVKVYGFTLSEAMKQAWLVSKLRYAMKTRIVKFHFQKVDGSIREAFGTLRSDLADATKGVRRASDKVVTYFDTEKQEYRCFKPANLLDVQF